MENEVVIHVRAEDETDRVFNQIKAKSKKFGEDVERDLKQSGKRAGSGLADGVSEGAKNAGDSLERKMEDSGRKAGDKAGKGIADGIKGVSAGDNFGERLFDFVTKSGEKAGKNAGRSMGDGIADMLNGHPAITGAVLALGATVAPLLASAVGAGIIGTGGLLGIAGGFAASVKDPRVKGSLQSLKKEVSESLMSAGESFAPTAVRSVGMVKKAFEELMPTIRSVFSKSDALMDPFVSGILDGVSEIVKGIEQSLDGAGPVMESFGDLFRNFGKDFGEVFTDLEDNSGELATSIDMLSEILGYALDAITAVIEVSAGWLAQFPALRQDIAETKDSIADWIDGLDGVKDAVDEVSLKGAVWHDGIGDTTEKIEEQKKALQGLSEEMQKQADPLYNLISAQSDVADAQSKYNEALRKHGPKSEEARDALIKLGKAVGNVSSAAGKAADSGFDGNLTPAMRNVMKQANLTDKQINELEKALRSARGAADRWEGTFTQTYITKYKEMGLKSPSGGMGGFQGHAAGGITGAASGGVHSNSRMVGEYGPELIDLPPGSHVYSNPDTKSFAAKQAAMGSGPTGYEGNPAAMGKMRITFDPAGANDLVRAIMKMLREEIRGEGGNVQTVLGIG